MNDKRLQPLAVPESSPRYASEASLRMKSRSTDSNSPKQIEGQKRVRRQTQNVQPYEYTIYLAPEEDIDESTLEKIKSILPIGTSNPSQAVSYQSDISNSVHSAHTSSSVPHTNFPHQQPCAPCTPCVHLPVTQPISTHNQISSVVSNCNPLHSCPPLPQSIPLVSPSNTKSPSISCSPGIPTYPPVSAVPMPSNTVPTINAPNLVQCETSTIPPLTTATPDSIVTATTSAPLATTASPSNHTLSELCQNHNKTGACSIVIKKAIILLNGNQSPANLSSVAKAFSNLNDNDNDNDFEDLQENDDVTILDGRDAGIDSPIGAGSTSNKSPSIGLKIIDLLEKVHHELQISNQRNTEPSYDDDYSNDEEVGSFSFENDCNDEIELNTKDSGNSAHDKTERNPSEQKTVKKCETGEDFLEAFKNLSKTIASYQQPAQKHEEHS